MKISDEILDDIVNRMPSVPPETGGIIGGKEGKVCFWEFDTGYSERGCSYRPNVDSLNRLIEVWIDKGYDFMGVLHVHFGGSKTLSDGDKKYIEKIMKAMPDSVEQLYFPIVVQPEKSFISYVAYRNQFGEIIIAADPLEVFI